MSDTSESGGVIARRTCTVLAAAAIGVAGLAIVNGVPAAAQPCGNWTLPNPEFVLNLSNGQTAVLSTSGNELTGGRLLVPGDTRYSGRTGGAALRGSNVEFTVAWTRTAGNFGGTNGAFANARFNGQVGADGIARGSALDNENARVDWVSRDRLVCADAPAPTPAPRPEPSQQQAPPSQAPAAPKQGPTVTSKEELTGVTFTVTDRSGVASQCSYSSEGFEKSFALPASGTADLFVPAVRLFTQRTGTITCDNGTSTNTSVFF